MASIVRITLLTSNDLSQDRANALARLVAAEETRASVEANVWTEAVIEPLEPAVLDALASKETTPRVRRVRKSAQPA